MFLNNYTLNKKGIFKKTPFLFKYLFLILVSFLSWNYFGLLFVINILFFFELLEKEYSNFNKYYINTLMLTISWNIGAIGWLLSVEQGLAAILINSIVYTFPFVIFFFLKKKIHLFFFIPIWLFFEFIINSVAFPTPLLTIGNAMGNQLYLIQWYKYTTVLGGSFWLLIISYYIWRRIKYIVILLVFLPILFSIFLLDNTHSTLDVDNDVMSSFTVFNNSKLSKKKERNIVSYLHNKRKYFIETDYFILPETTISIDSKNYSNSLLYKSLIKMIRKNNVKNIMFGAVISVSKKTKINAVVTSTSSNAKYLTVKKKLVPFSEYVPIPFRPFYKKKSIIANVNDNSDEIVSDLSINQLVCYDIFFPFYVSKKSKDSKLIILFSSEAFLNNSFFGKKFFQNICKIRAVENNKLLLKCSNSGNSVLINEKGTIIDDSKGKEFYTFHLPNSLIK